MTDADKAPIAAEGCLECGGPVHVLPEGVLCMDCDKLVPLSAYKGLFAVKAGYEDVPTQDNAPR